jgi:hypothetical protein
MLGRITLALIGIVLVAASSIMAASAGPPGTWTRVTDGDRRNIDDVGLARTADGALHVLWQRRAGPSSTGVAHTLITKAGKVGGTSPVLTGLRSVDDPVVLVLPDGKLQAFFHALGDTLEQGGVAGATAPASGVGWSKQGSRASSNTGSAGPVGGTVMADGTPAFAYSQSFHLRAHLGTDPGAADLELQPNNQCCDYVPELATDAKSGQTILAYYSNAKGRTGTWARQVAPSVGAPKLAPGSVSGGKAIGIDQHVALSSRLGAPGVYLGYCGGYPTCTRTLLWRVGAGKPLQVGGGKDVEDVDVAPGPEGRLWIAWHDGQTKQVLATRTNKAATRVGPVVVVAPPKGTSSMWKLAGEGSLGPLDVLVSATAGGSLQTWHTQVLPQLQLSVTKGKKTVKLLVRDAGDPVVGATVKVGGAKLKTNAAGVATAKSPAKTVAAVASKAGYRPARISVKGS